MDYNEIVRRLKEPNKEVILFLGAGVHYHAPEPPDPPVQWVYPRTARPKLAGEVAHNLATQSGWSQRFDPHTNPAISNFTRVTLDYELFIEEDLQAGPKQHAPVKSQRAKILRQQGRTRLANIVRAEVQTQKQISPIVKALAELAFPIVVTTNYDHHYEDAAISHGANPTVTWYHRDKTGHDNDYRPGDPSPQNPFVFKIHGDISDADSLVITDEDYIDFVMRMTEGPKTNPVPSTVSHRMGRWPTLFVGYSLADFNLRLLLKTLCYERDVEPSVAVSRFPDPLISRVWQDENELVTFIAEDVWTFVPRLYKEVLGKPMP